MKLELKQQVAAIGARASRAAHAKPQAVKTVGMVVGLGLSVLAGPASAAALTPVTGSVQILVDTIAAVCLPLATAFWGYAGVKMGFFGASARDMSQPFWGGLITGAAGGIAAGFVQ